MEQEPDVFFHAEQVARQSMVFGSDLLVIGAAALAGHGYVRLTMDLDLAGNLPAQRLRDLCAALQESGYVAELREPDANDPLGGVLDVQGRFGQIQVISFEGRFPAVIQDGLAGATLRLREDSLLKIIPLPQLVALKLYAGGFKSKADIVEVLSINPAADLDEIETLCGRYRVSGFAEIRRELGR
jgi:hypothetical protein